MLLLNIPKRLEASELLTFYCKGITSQLRHLEAFYSYISLLNEIIILAKHLPEAISTYIALNQSSKHTRIFLFTEQDLAPKIARHGPR